MRTTKIHSSGSREKAKRKTLEWLLMSFKGLLSQVEEAAVVAEAGVAHTFDPSSWEVEAGKSEFQASWSTQFQDRQGYTKKRS